MPAPSAATALQADYEMLSALDEGTWQHRPISETQVASLPTHQHISSKKVLIFPLPASHSTGLQKVRQVHSLQSVVGERGY